MGALTINDGVIRDQDGRIPPCPKCKQRWEPEFSLGPFGPHWAKCKCKACGCVWFPPKPDVRTKRESKHTDLVRKFSRGYCEICGLLEVGRPAGMFFVAHHIDEYQAGGDADRSNVQILCQACHTLVHWRRTYVKHLLPNGVKHVDRKEHPEGDTVPSELDSLEDGLQGRGQADEGSDSGDWPGGEHDGPDDMG